MGSRETLDGVCEKSHSGGLRTNSPVCTAIAFGFSLCVTMSCTFCVIFGRGLALRGPHGTQSVHTAVDNLRRQQRVIFVQFIISLVSYLISHIFEVWIYFRNWIAIVVTCSVSIFFLLIVYYTVTITLDRHYL